MKIDMYLPCMLQNKVCLEVAAITDVTLARVFANLQTRIQRYLDAGGGHFQHML
jgi:hypothetical protein